MIEGKGIIKGGSIYIKILDCTFSKSEILELNDKQLIEVLGFMSESELNIVQNWDDKILLKVLHIYERL